MRILKNKVCWLGLLFYLIFVWLNSFLRLVNYNEPYEISRCMLLLLTLAFTMLFYFLIMGGLDSYEFLHMINIQKCQTISWLMSTVVVISLLLESFYIDFSIFGPELELLGFVSISKKYIFNPLTIIGFPYFVELLCKSMQRETFSAKSVLSGSIQIVTFTCIEYLLFMDLSIVWIWNIGLLHVITIITAIRKYCWRKINKKGNIIAIIILYTIFLMLLLLMHSGYGSFGKCINESGWLEYRQNVRELIDNANWFGASDTLKEMHTVHSFLANYNNYLHSIIYYFGKIAGLLLLLFLVAFVIITVKMLDTSKKNVHRHYLIFSAVSWMLIIRVIIGIAYSLGAPLPIMLPFAGNTSVYTDTVLLALLFICVYENTQISQYMNCRAISIREYLKTDICEYYIVDKETGEKYDEEIYWDSVIIKSNGENISCSAVWFIYENGEFAVFEPENALDEVFVLEHYQNGIWKEVKEEIKEKIFSDYILYAEPDCMEVEEDGKDEEDTL